MIDAFTYTVHVCLPTLGGSCAYEIYLITEIIGLFDSSLVTIIQVTPHYNLSK